MGLKRVIDYFKGHKVLGFMPDYVITEKKQDSPHKNPIPDDLEYLKFLASEGNIVTTPP